MTNNHKHIVDIVLQVHMHMHDCNSLEYHLTTEERSIRRGLGVGLNRDIIT